MKGHDKSPAVLNGTDRAVANRYSSVMSPESFTNSPDPIMNEGFAERSAAWQARDAANDRAARRRFFIIGVLAAVLMLSVTILDRLWGF